MDKYLVVALIVICVLLFAFIHWKKPSQCPVGKMMKIVNEQKETDQHLFGEPSYINDSQCVSQKTFHNDTPLEYNAYEHFETGTKLDTKHKNLGNMQYIASELDNFSSQQPCDKCMTSGCSVCNLIDDDDTFIPKHLKSIKKEPTKGKNVIEVVDNMNDLYMRKLNVM